MHTAWGVFWWLWGACMIMGMMFAAVLPDYIWFFAFGIFLIPEVIGAVIANRKGDTFSQSLWTLSQHGFALRLFSCAVGAALGLKMWSLYYIIAEMADVPVIWWERLSWDAFSFGAITWLFLHFLYLGKKG